MSSRQKYRKMVIGPVEKITARNSLVGMLCVADYNDPVSRTHTLLFERQTDKPGVAIDTESTKGRRKKKAANGSDDSPSKSLAFPGESAPSA
jgi:hypothetical protein